MFLCVSFQIMEYVQKYVHGLPVILLDQGFYWDFMMISTIEYGKTEIHLISTYIKCPIAGLYKKWINLGQPVYPPSHLCSPFKHFGNMTPIPLVNLLTIYWLGKFRPHSTDKWSNTNHHKLKVRQTWEWSLLRQRQLLELGWSV